MKIISIKLNIEAKSKILEGDIILKPVILTVKKLFSKPFEIKAYPTNYGPTYGSTNIIFFYYVDENGKKFNDEINEQINNFQNIKK